MLPGEFTVPLTGVWRVSFSLQSAVSTGQENHVYIYHNQQKKQETWHYTYSKDARVVSTGGRELITRAERGNTFHLGTGTMKGWFNHIITGTMKGWFNHIITCFEFVSL